MGQVLFLAAKINMSHGLCLQTQIIFAAVFTVKCYGSYLFSCAQLSPCSCRLQTNSVIDLGPLARRDGRAAFTAVRDTDGGVYAFNPCYDFTDPAAAGKCEAVAVCRENSTDGTYSSLGVQQNVSFGYDDDSSCLFLRFPAMGHEIEKETKIYLECTPHEEHSSLRARMAEPSVYALTLRSSHACPSLTSSSHLSTGTILCIIFFCVVSVYLGTGVLYRRIVHRSQGWDVLPHGSLWRQLPGLIQDGYLFFISPCLGNTVAYQAYRYEPL